MNDFDESFKETRRGNSDVLKFTYRRNVHALFWSRGRVFQVVYLLYFMEKISLSDTILFGTDSVFPRVPIHEQAFQKYSTDDRFPLLPHEGNLHCRPYWIRFLPGSSRLATSPSTPARLLLFSRSSSKSLGTRLILYSDTPLRKLNNTIQIGMDRITNWLNVNKLSVKTTKTKFILFRSTNRKQSQNISITMNNENLEQ